MLNGVKEILFVVIGGYLGIMVLLYITQRNMMYFPAGPREDIATLTKVLPVNIPVHVEDGIDFDAWYWPAVNKKQTIVFFHGNGQAYPYWVSKMMAYHNLGYGVFITDYRGYGGVGGKLSEQGIYTDARAHLKALMNETSLSPNDLVYYGESLGTGVAIQMATETPPRSIILESAYSATNDVAKSRYWMFPIDLLMKDKFRSIDKISGLTMPKLFVHGADDIVIPERFGLALFDAAPEPKKRILIEGAGHNNLYDHGAQLHIVEFLSTLSLKINQE